MTFQSPFKPNQDSTFNLAKEHRTRPKLEGAQGLLTLCLGRVPVQEQLSQVLAGQCSTNCYLAQLRKVCLPGSRSDTAEGSQRSACPRTYLHQHICRKKCDSEVVQGEDPPEGQSRPVLHVLVAQPYREQIQEGEDEGGKVGVQQEPPSNSRVCKEGLQ